MTVKNVDYKQEPIENPFSFQWGLFFKCLTVNTEWLEVLIRNSFSRIDASIQLYIEIVYADQSILKLNLEERTLKMC